MKNQSPLTVFEFNGTTIRICRSVAQRSKRMVTHCFSFEVEDFDKDAQPLIAKELKTHNLRPDNVILSLPRYVTLSRFLRLPSQVDEEIKDMVSLHVSREKTFGKDKKEIVYDYQKVGVDEEGRSLVSVFLIQQAKLERYLGILGRLGIFPSRVTLNTEGLLRWSSQKEKISEGESQDRCVFFLNIDHGMFDFNAIVKGCSIFSRTFVSPKVESFDQTQWLAKEIKLCIELFHRAFGSVFKGTDRLCVTGISDDFQKAVSMEALPLPIINLDLWEDLDTDPAVKQEMLDAGVSFASVLGLALKEGRKGIDITPAELKKATQKKLAWRTRRETALFAAMTAFIFSLFVLRFIDLKTNELDVLRQELSVLSPIEKEMEKTQRAAFINKVILGAYPVSKIFDGFYDLTPDTVFITDFRLETGKTLAMTGAAQDAITVFHYLESLKHFSLFKDVRLDYVNNDQKPSGNGVKFKITAFLRNHEN